MYNKIYWNKIMQRAFFTMLFFKHITAGASSQCYWDELIPLKCELMILKCQINTNTNKNGFLLPTKCLEGVLKYSYLGSIILKFFLSLRMFKVKFVTFTLHYIIWRMIGFCKIIFCFELKYKGMIYNYFVCLFLITS